MFHIKGSISISSLFQSILLSDESSEADSHSEDNDEGEEEDDDEEEELSLSREDLHNMLRLHKYKKLHQNKYSKEKEVKSSRRNFRFSCWVFTLVYINCNYLCNFIFKWWL